MAPPQPLVADVVGIIEYVRTGASAEYPVEALPDGLTAWRRRLRARAHLAGVRVSVRLFGPGVVTVFHPDYEPTREEWGAMANVLAADVTGELTYDAVHARRRARLHVVRDEE